jgi:ATP-dependent DNA ligase
VAFRDGDRVELRSRNDRPLGRYFPELVAAVSEVTAEVFVLDGEILVSVGDRYDFATLMTRLHPAASRVDHLSAAAPATFLAFDLLAIGDRDLRDEPFTTRRMALEQLIGAGNERLRHTAATGDPDGVAAWLRASDGAGVDGVMAKPHDLTYRAGERAMLKVKLERTLDCVVGGFRLLADRPLPSSLLLGLYDDSGSLAHIGIAASFSERLRRELLEALGPLAVPLPGHPWEHGYLLEGSPVGRLKGAAGRWAPDEMSLRRASNAGATIAIRLRARSTRSPEPARRRAVHSGQGSVAGDRLHQGPDARLLRARRSGAAGARGGSSVDAGPVS